MRTETRDRRPATVLTVGAVVAGLLSAVTGSVADASGLAPTAVTPATYGIAEGDDLVLDGSASSDPEADVLDHSWDVDGDGVFGDAVGATPTVPWGELVARGVDDDGSYPISLRVDDGTSSDTTSATLTITNTAPTITARGDSMAAAGGAYRLTLDRTDPGDDTVTGWAVDWGDGSFTGSIPLGAQVITHSYGAGFIGSTVDIQVTVSDEDGTHPSAATPTLQTTVTAGLQVNSTGDAGDALTGDGVCDTGGVNAVGDPECTLRAAISEANSAAAADLIGFDIPTADSSYDGAVPLWTISPATALPVVATEVVIDGGSQPGWSAGDPIIALDGAATTGADGLHLAGADSVVRGLAVGGFDATGMVVTGARVRLEANHIGVDAEGTAAVPNGGAGLYVAAPDAQIGGSLGGGNVIGGNAGAGMTLDTGAEGAQVVANVIGLGSDALTPVGNGAQGVQVSSVDDVTVGAPGLANYIGDNGLGAIQLVGKVTNSRVQANVIGVGFDLVTARGNSASGIQVGPSSSGNLIGGPDPGAGNVVRHSQNAGVILHHDDTVADNAVLQNTLSDNGGLGIDLSTTVAGNGVDPNDAGDGDTGPNGLLNHPVIDRAVEIGGTVTVDFTLDVPAGAYRIDFADNPGGADPSGHGEAEQPTSFVWVNHGGSGPESFTHRIAGAAGDTLTAVATAAGAPGGYGATSEFGNAYIVADGNDPIGHWRFDEADGSVAIDSGPGGHDGAFGGDADHEGGIHVTSAGFAGAGEVVVPDPVGGDLDVGSGDFTVVFWMRTGQDPSQDVTLVQKLGPGPGDAGWGVWLEPGGSIRAEVVSAAGSATVTGPALDDERWHLVALRRSAGEVTLRVDGASSSVSVTTGSVDNAEPLRLGRESATAPGFVGRLDEVSLYQRALPGVEIDQARGDLLTVNSSGDAADAAPGDGICSTGAVTDMAMAECTLRAALQEADATPSVGAIAFAIPIADGGHSGGVWTIAPGTRYPNVSEGFVIDATTQPGYAGAPVISLDGSSLSVSLSNSGFSVDNTAVGWSLRGMSVHGFGNDGAIANADASILADNYFGVLPDGVTAPGNQSEGVVVGDSATGTVIRDNLFGGHPNAALALNDSADAIVVQGNRFGVDPSGTIALPNSQAIWSDTSGGGLIGGLEPGQGNVMANSTGNAIELNGTTARFAILGNSIVDNGALGINFGGGLTHTPNDPGDTDNGPNDLLNFPVITDATVIGGVLTVDFTLDVPAGTYRVEVFTNPSGADPTFHGEGEVFAGATTVTHTGSGAEAFSATAVGSSGDFVTTTATRVTAGPTYEVTSEFSLGTLAVSPVPMVVNSTADNTDASTADGVCDTGGVNAIGDPECTLRAAIVQANATPGADIIEFAIPVADPGHSAGIWTITPGSALPDITDRVALDASTQPGFVANTNAAPLGLNGQPVVELDGSGAGAGADGLVVRVPDVSLRGLVLHGFDNDAVNVHFGADRFSLTASYVGTTPAGSVPPVANTDDGVDLESADSVIGGVDPADRNLISGNLSDGIALDLTATRTTVAGNIIGLDAAGLVPVPNVSNGVQIWNGPTDNVVGGLTAASANLIAGNGSDEVRVSDPGTTGNRIVGNWIGLDASGVTGVGNRRGVIIELGAADNIVGPGNVLSGNTDDGVFLGGVGTVRNRVIGNLVGLRPDGTAALPNGDRGVQIDNGASDNVVGGTGPGERNVISGNGREGVLIGDFTSGGTTGNQILANWIGTDGTGAAPVPNLSDGVRVVAAGGNVIGGASLFEGNLIAFNGDNGVEISATALTDNAITWNRIFANSGLGIDLGDDDVTVNDPGDSDPGPNDLLNHPIIRTAASAGGSAAVVLDVDLPAGDYLLHLHTNAGGLDPSGYGEGETPVHAEPLLAHPGGTATVIATIAADQGAELTATATRTVTGALRATSEFSPGVTVTAADAVVNATGDGADALVGDLRCDTGLLNAEGDPECTLRAAMQEVDAAAALSDISFAIPITDIGYTGVWTIGPGSPLPPITGPMTIDGSTQPGSTPATVAAPGPLTSADLKVVVDGSGAGAADGFSVDGGPAELRGMRIQSFMSMGIEIDTTAGVLVVGNEIVDNGNHGVSVEAGSSSVTIGGTAAADRNLISGNVNRGVRVDSASGVAITGNLIGTDTAGTAPHPNGLSGVILSGTTTAVTLGDGTPTGANVISGNGEGVVIQGPSDIRIDTNRIGPDSTGALLGNGDAGVAVVAGRDVDVVGNWIAGNSGHGVEHRGADEVTIITNSFHDNGGLGIDLGNDLVTANDPGDGDAGSNDLLNFPELVDLSASAGSVTAHFDLDVPIGRYRIDFYANPAGADPSGHGEGGSWLGSVAIDHPGGSQRYVRTFPGAVGEVVSAVTTQDLVTRLGSSSEQSAVFTVLSSTSQRTPDATSRVGDLEAAGGLSLTATAGPIGSAQEIGGGPSRLVGAPTDVVSGGLTLSGWIQAKDVAAEPRLVAKSDGAGNRVYELWLDGSARPRATVTAGGSRYEVTGSALLVGTWYHLAATWDGATLRLYVDGVEVDRLATAGALDLDPAIPLVVGNDAGATSAVEGVVDEIRVSHLARSADWIATTHSNQWQPASFVTVGPLQTGAVGGWTATAAQPRSGVFALEAPVTDTLHSWITADGIVEPGVEFDTWWWFSGGAAPLAQGVRTGAVPVVQHETSLTGPSGWDLGRIDGAGRTQDLPPPAGQTPNAGAWTRVTVRIDQNATMTVLIDGAVVIGPTPVAGALGPGSVGLRGQLPTGEQWYVDDALARRLVAVEPVASLGPPDRP